MFNFNEHEVRNWIETQNWSFNDVVRHLERAAGIQRGLSVRSLRRFCTSNGISRRSKISDAELRRHVQHAVADETGLAGGYRSVKASLESRGTTKVAEKRIRRALETVDPNGVAVRRTMARVRLNPKRYHGRYFGYNLHMDQNEKLVDYGIVFVAAMDGYSGFVFEVAVMGKKNNLAIYRELLLKIIQKYGLFRRVIVDHGGEFVLTLFMQQYYAILADPGVEEQSTYIRTQSTKNNRIERFWVEVNQRVGYPLKMALLDMEEMNVASADIPHHLYSMSFVGRWIAKAGLDVTTRYMNQRYVRRRGKPVTLMQQSFNTVRIPDASILDVDQAHDLYQRASNGLTEESEVGFDLLANLPAVRDQRDQIFANGIVPRVGDAEYVYGCLANNHYRPFQRLVNAHIRLSEHLFTIHGNRV